MPDYNGVKFSKFPQATGISGSDQVVGLQNGNNTRFSFASILYFVQSAISSLFVPLTRKINNKSLSADITLTPSDVGAVPTYREINGYPLSADVTLDYSDVGAVPATREINGQSLTDDITLDADDVGARADDWMPSAADVGAQEEITASGILKGDGNGGVSAAVAGTDYQTPLAAGTDYATPAMLEPEEITSYTLTNATPSIAAIQTASTTCYRIGKQLFFFLSFKAGANAIAPGTTFADLTVDSCCFAMISGVTGDCAITGTRLGATRVVLKLIGSSSVAANDTFGCSMMLLLN